MRRIGLIVVACALLPLSFTRTPEARDTIILEAENYAELVAPMRVARGDVQASGNTYLELPLGSGQGWRGLGTGSVTYRVAVALDGDYFVWGRFFWGDGCTNAAFMQVNAQPRIIIGNDAVFGVWHWVKALPQRMNGGINYITLSNHSDGIYIDKFVITNDPAYSPEGLGDGITYFYDGFAGCDADNTGSWTFVSGDWKVVKAVGDDAAGANDCLAQWNEAGGYALAGLDSWSVYSANLSMMCAKPALSGMVFGHCEGKGELRLLCQSDGRTARIWLEEHSGNEVIKLAEAENVPFMFDRWYTIGFQRAAGAIEVVVDDNQVFSVSYDHSITGKIGLVTVSGGGIFFDNVDVRFQ
jgi:hypothetical protein